MRQRFVTDHARSDLQEIIAYIGAENPSAAVRYLDAAMASFAGFPEDLYTPKPASPDLPGNVHEIRVQGFKGYTLRILLRDDACFLLNAFRPGLPENNKDMLTRHGLDEA